MNARNCLLVGVVFSFIGASQVLAVTITPSSATATSAYGTRFPSATRDSSGLTGNQHTNLVGGDPEPMWLTSGGQLDPEVGVSTVTGQSITWTLPSKYDLTGFHLWNYNEGAQTSRGLKYVTIEVADNAGFTLNLQTITSYASGTGLTQASGANTYTGEDYTLSATGQYVRFTVISNFSAIVDNLFSNPFTGASEIRFEGTAVPEPMSAGLFACGALGMLVARRRRRSAK
jgi:hypothetical protein